MDDERKPKLNKAIIALIAAISAGVGALIESPAAEALVSHLLERLFG